MDLTYGGIEGSGCHDLVAGGGGLSRGVAVEKIFQDHLHDVLGGRGKVLGSGWRIL